MRYEATNASCAWTWSWKTALDAFVSPRLYPRRRKRATQMPRVPQNAPWKGGGPKFPTQQMAIGSRSVGPCEFSPVFRFPDWLLEAQYGDGPREMPKELLVVGTLKEGYESVCLNNLRQLLQPFVTCELAVEWNRVPSACVDGHLAGYSFDDGAFISRRDAWVCQRCFVGVQPGWQLMAVGVYFTRSARLSCDWPALIAIYTPLRTNPPSEKIRHPSHLCRNPPPSSHSPPTPSLLTTYHPAIKQLPTPSAYISILCSISNTKTSRIYL